MIVSGGGNRNVVLFDGVCNLCNFSIDFIVRYEKGDELRFASLQSELGKELVAKFNLDIVPDSILFYSNNELHAKSKAVLKICRFMKFPLSILTVFRFVPKVLSDTVYDFVAKNRYKWFGKKETCRVPTAEEREKFLG